MGFILGEPENVLKLDLVMVAQPCEYTIKNIKLYTLNCIMCELYLNNAVLRNYQASTSC